MSPQRRSLKISKCSPGAQLSPDASESCRAESAHPPGGGYGADSPRMWWGRPRPDMVISKARLDRSRSPLKVCTGIRRPRQEPREQTNKQLGKRTARDGCGATTEPPKPVLRGWLEVALPRPHAERGHQEHMLGKSNRPACNSLSSAVQVTLAMFLKTSGPAFPHVNNVINAHPQEGCQDRTTPSG